MGDRLSSLRVAAVQAAPVVLEREATLERVALWTRRAAEREARLVVFPESFVPAYPASPVFGALFGGFFEPLAGALFERLSQNAVDVPGPATAALGQTAREHALYLSIGVTERTPSGTLHCTLLLFGPTGELLQARRKLTPTHDERMVWGPGPAVAPVAVPSEFGPIGQLACWENYMPLARHALYRSGERIHLAPTADASDGWQATLRHIALEGRVFVIGCNQYVTRAMYPRDFEPRAALERAPEVLCRGGSAIVAPDGRYLAGPLYGEEGLLVADLDLGEVVRGRQLLDVVGHYSRPDVFREP